LDPSTVRYFSDFSAVNESSAVIIPLYGTPYLCSGQAGYDYALIKNKLPYSEIKVLPEIGEVSGFEYDFEGQLDFKTLFISLKQKYAVKRIGIIGRLTFPSIIYRKMAEVFSGAEIVDFDGEFYEYRVVKTDSEIACIKKASDIISETYRNAVPRIKEGMTELEIQALFESGILENGAESNVMAFNHMVATGDVNSHISMCRNTSRKVGKSEIINLAGGASYEGYNGVICSPYVLGEIPRKIKDAIRCAYDALNHTSSLMKDGVTCDIVLNAYTDYLKKYGYIDYCPYGSLHSTGLLECEAPVFSVKNKRIIKKNMTICIDAYFKGMEWGSFRIEDNYVITDKGAERMTKYNDEALPLLLNK
ncbi:MAG: aminopeptidase P family protein, partial [Clostridia bacterium]|nr:aminopeptidase P family protein [Clostridia bacterium]